MSGQTVTVDQDTLAGVLAVLQVAYDSFLPYDLPLADIAREKGVILQCAGKDGWDKVIASFAPRNQV